MRGLHSAKAVGRRMTAASAAGAAQTTDPVLCKNCVHFRSQIGRLEFGKCHHYYEIDLVTGEKAYMYASIARQHLCGGEHFRQRKKSWFGIDVSMPSSAIVNEISDLNTRDDGRRN